jgi:hypothetical protein
MRLMRWLAACRSLKSVEDGPSPYRMTQQNLVPRFGRTAGTSGFGVGKVLRRWFTEWLIGPWRPLMAKVQALCKPPRLPGRRKRAKTPVQPELLLDTVRVLRNDLRDEDLTVRAKRAEEPICAGPGPGAGAGRAWGRITSRIFGPGQSVR